MPSIAPALPDDRDVYLVLDDFGGRLGRAWRETDEESAERHAVITDLLDGQFSNPVRVIAFNTLEHWSKDVSGYVAEEIQIRCDIEGRAVPDHIRDFLKSHTARANQLRGFNSALI